VAKKPLNIGLVGYGFMGRTHSNGYKRVNDFFHELEYRPVLKAICGSAVVTKSERKSSLSSGAMSLPSLTGRL